MSKQPEALRLACELEQAPYSSPCTNEAAAELRRLMAKIADLEEAARVLSEVATERNRLEAQRDELLEALLAIAALPAHPMRKKGVEIAAAAIAKAKGELK